MMNPCAATFTPTASPPPFEDENTNRGISDVPKRSNTLLENREIGRKAVERVLEMMMLEEGGEDSKGKPYKHFLLALI